MSGTTRVAALALALLGIAGVALGADAFPVAPGAPASGFEASLVPLPQFVEDKGQTIALDDSWSFVLDTGDADYTFLWRWFTDMVRTDAPLVLGISDGASASPAPRRIIVGEPARHSFVSDALARRGRALPGNLGDEGYLLEVYPGRPAEIVIAANGAHGAFNAIATLIQLVQSDSSIPACLIVDHPEHAIRGTYEPGSIRLDYSDGAYHFTAENKTFIDWLAAHKFNTVFAVENGAFFRDESEWRDAYMELFEYARRRYIEPIPRICSISTVSPFAFEYYEGWYVQNERLVFQDGAAHPMVPYQDLIANGSFETDSDGDGKPDGWTATDRPGATWSIDDTVAYSGSRSMRLSIPSAAPESNAATLRTTIEDIAPNSYYCLWAKARAVGIAEVEPQLTMYVRNGEGEVTVLQSDVTWDTSGWKNFGTCIWTPADSDRITLYSRIQHPGTGRFWLDDVQLYRVSGSLRNVIRADDTDFTVTDPTGTTEFVLGRDYEVEDGETSMRFQADLKPFVIRRLPTGRIPAGGEVSVSYDAYFFYKASQYWRSAPCVARDELYTEYYYPAIDAVVERLHPRFINVDADEVRGFYRDSRMRERFETNAEAIAYWGNRLADYVRSVDPECRLWIWDDMVSPYHNGGVESYQVNYGGLPGRMAEATEKGMLDTSIVQDVWWYGDSRISQMWHSILYFQDRGFDVLGSPWSSQENIVSWSEMLLGQPGSLGGVETNWGTPYQEAHRWFADNFWNTRHSLVLFDSFETDGDADGFPDGWRFDGGIAYPTDGSECQGSRYADFPNAAIGVLTDTLAVESSPLPVRPSTQYVLSAYVKREAWASDEVHPAIEWYAASDLLGEQTLHFVGIEPDYTKLEGEATSPPGAVTAVIRLDSSHAGVWYDVVRLKEETRYLGIVGPQHLISASVGLPIQRALTAVGGSSPYRWAVVGGQLPPGVAVDERGYLAGTPTEVGTYEFVLRVTDASMRVDEAEHVIAVAPFASERAFVPIAAQTRR